MELAETVIIDAVILVLSLFFILLSAEVFTNGIEWLGHKLHLSEGVIGSVLAAVGTALPETMIPVVAIFGHSENFHQIGIGAIAGAPFMLSTLTMCVCGTAVFAFSRMGKRSSDLTINKTILTRDLGFFLVAYSIGLLATLATDFLALRQVIAFCLLIIYLVYLRVTFTHEAELTGTPGSMYLDRFFKLGTSLPVVTIQVLIGLLGILLGANIFVERVNSLAHAIAVPGIILAMIISPIATELPEKCNSIIWMKAKKDTLALGNITGAMVFQSCFPVAFGVAFTKWDLGFGTILSGIVALTSAAIMFLLIRNNALKYQYMLVGGLVYATAVGYIIWSGCTE